MKIPRDFPKWDKTVDGLQDAGKWALDCERSRLPAGILMPRTGQVWESVKDCEVQFRAHIDFPQSKVSLSVRLEQAFLEAYMMQFGSATLQRGERVRILELGEPKPLSIRFVPVRYDELHETVIPAKVRALATYRGGYELSAKTARTISDFQTACLTYFNEDFHLVEDVA